MSSNFTLENECNTNSNTFIKITSQDSYSMKAFINRTNLTN